MFQIILAALIELVSFAVGAVIFWRRSYEQIALVVSLFLVIFVTDLNNNLEALTTLYPAWVLPVKVLNFVWWPSIILVFYLFPNGRFVPRWTRWLALGFVLFDIITTFFPGFTRDRMTPLNTLNTILFFASWFSFAAVQIYRYVRISTPVQRQQTKWVVFGGAIALLSLGVISIAFPAVVNQPQSILDFLGGALAYFLFFLIPISFAIAVLRYRLWDVDVLINKALVYGLLTVLLGALYAGLIIGIEGLTGVITGPKSQQPLVLVISTLVIVVLFHPVRQRIQSLIDQRYYRRKYDAARTLESFSIAARDEVELGKLTDQLLAVADETMQPLHISLWLKPTGDRKSYENEDRRKA
jgi:hypothetical protein